jgi:hypothetical protein
MKVKCYLAARINQWTVYKAEFYTMSRQIVFNILSPCYQWRLSSQDRGKWVLTDLADMLRCGYIYIYFVCDHKTHVRSNEIHDISVWSGDFDSTTEVWQLTNFHIEDSVQHYGDRYKADVRRGGKGKTQQDCCNMNDVYVFDTSEQ